jgi:hypothetical protein
MFSADEGTPVTDAYEPESSRFTGKIHRVTVELKPEGAAAR